MTPPNTAGLSKPSGRFSPNAAITTDMMVGFAGETEEEFAQSLAFAKEIAFAKVHVFAYSRRPGTVAYNMPGQVSNAEKEARSHALIEATEETRRAFLQEQLGRVEPVLFEQEAAKKRMGRLHRQLYAGAHGQQRTAGGKDSAGAAHRLRRGFLSGRAWFPCKTSFFSGFLQGPLQSFTNL